MALLKSRAFVLIAVALMVGCGSSARSQDSALNEHEAQATMVTVVAAEGDYFKQNHSYTADLGQLAGALKPPASPGEWTVYNIQVVLKDDGKTFCVQSTTGDQTTHYDLGSGEALDGSC